jgi:CRP/FNR family transcriptional regulator, nitrogen oxide reductase regulator
MVDVSDLKELEVFRVLSDSQLQQVARIAEKIVCKVNSHFYKPGDQASYLFVLRKGFVVLRELKPDEQIGIAFEMRQAGAWFGAASFMRPQQYTLNGLCLEDSEVLAIDADKLLDLCEADVEMGYRLLKTVAMLYLERFKTTKRQLFETATAPLMMEGFQV